MCNFTPENVTNLKNMRALLLSVMMLLTPMLQDVPKMLQDDEAAKYYCMDILNISDEQYSRDTAQVNDMIRHAEWVEEHIIERYGILAAYCDRQLQLRREARSRTMPEGNLVSFYYREYGSSRPDEVVYELRRDNASNRWQLNGKEVADTVANRVRELAEREKIYQCLRTYAEPPSFPRAPLVTGGPPSWQFSCKFEGGEINSASECMPVPASCCAIVNYLKSLN